MKRLFVALIVGQLFQSTLFGVGLINGSFEDPYVYPSSALNLTTFPGAGWVIANNNIDLLSNAYPWSGSPIGPIRTPFGDQFIDLNGLEAGTIYQDFTFPSSGEWVIRFDMEANPNPPPDVKSMSVDFGLPGALSVLGSYSRVPRQDAWVTITTPSFTVDDATTYRLQFRSTIAGYGGLLLDNIQIQPVPEPSVFTLFGLGSIALAILKRTRRG